MRIYFIRHAEPHYPTDSLTPAGHREAQALAEHLAETGIDEIYSSPRGRARITAGYTAERLGLPVTVEPWSNELDGLYLEEYGRSLWDIDGPVLRDPRVLADLNGWSAVPPLDNARLAEHCAHVRAGSDDFLRRLGYPRQGHVYRVERPNRKSIAFFAHLGFGLTWLAHLLEIPLPLMYSGFFLHPSSVTTILLDERPAGTAVPRLLGVGDISHLRRAGLPPSPAGLIGNID